MAPVPASSRVNPRLQVRHRIRMRCSLRRSGFTREDASTDKTNPTGNRFITTNNQNAVISTPAAHQVAVFSRPKTRNPAINTGQMPSQMGTFTPTETSTPLQTASVGDWFHQHFRARRGSAHGLIAALGLHHAATREHTTRRQDWPATKKCARRLHKESTCG